eukprot:scaffold803_cov310-Pinguiococcus_pyrenoidosus.AAC.47
MIPPHVQPVFMDEAIRIAKQARLVVAAAAPHRVIHSNVSSRKKMKRSAKPSPSQGQAKATRSGCGC